MFRGFSACVVAALLSACSHEADSKPQPATNVARRDAAPESSRAEPKPAPTVSSAAPRKSANRAAVPTAANRKQQLLREALQSAIAAVSVDGFTEAKRERLRAVRDEMPLLKTSTEVSAPVWQVQRMNRLGEGIDAVRFRTPPGASTTMFLGLVFPGTVREFHLMPLERQPKKIEEWRSDWNVQIDDVPLPEENVLVLHFGKQPLTSDAEYLLWFKSEETEPWDLAVAVSLLPESAADAASGLEEIAHRMGVVYHTPTFSADAGGVKAALRFAESIRRRGAAGSQRFQKSLRAVAAALPELDVGRDGKTGWNRIGLNESGTALDAWRFASWENVPADLYYMLSAPRDESGASYTFGIVTDTPLRAPVYQFAVDQAAAGVELPAENLTYLKAVPYGQFAPRRECIFWVATPGEQPKKAVLGMRFSAEGPVPEPVTTRQLARILGLSIPEKPSPAQVASTRRMCRDWYLQSHNTADSRIRQALQSVGSEFPEIQVAAGEAAMVWNAVHLNADGIDFDVVRFKSSLPGPAELYCALGDARELSWQVLPAEGDGPAVRNAASIVGRRYEGLDLSARSQVWFAAITGDGFGHIEPGRDYLIWFCAPADAPPRELRLGVRLSPGLTKKWFASGREIAARMGLEEIAGDRAGGNILLGRHDAPVNDLCFTADGQRLASLDARGHLRLWDVSARRLTRKLDLDREHWAGELEVSPDGHFAAVALNKPAAFVVWDLQLGEKHFDVPDSRDGLDHGPVLAFSPDGGLLAVCTKHGEGPLATTGQMSVWDLEGRRRIRSAPMGDFLVRRMRWARPGSLIAACTRYSDVGGNRNAETILRVWDPESLAPVQDSPDTTGEPTDLSIAVAAPTIAMTGTTSVVKFWSLDDLQPLAPLTALGLPRTVALSDDGRFVALGALMPPAAGIGEHKEWAVQLWDLENARLRFVRMAHDGPIRRVAISPDGAWIASAGEDLTIQLWDATFPDPLVRKNSIGMKLVPIPAGSFLMGSPDSEQARDGECESPQHQVVISRPFLMAMHEVTVGQFRQFVEATGYKTWAEVNAAGGAHIVAPEIKFRNRPEYNWRNPGFRQDDSHPVVQISWNDANAFCRWLSDKEGVEYRLPTEAEWEYACRGNRTSAYSFQDHVTQLPRFGNTADLAIATEYKKYPVAAQTLNDGFAFTSPVCSFAPNEFGLYDMHGNAFEWCADWFDSRYYYQSPERDPPGPPTGKKRVLRGSSVFHNYWQARSAARGFDPPDTSESCSGFRPIRVIAD